MLIYDQSYEVRRLSREDAHVFQQLIHLFAEVFETEKSEAPEDYLKSLLENQGFMVFVVIQQDMVLGGLTAYTLPMYHSRSAEVFIYDVAIHSQFQRRGLGNGLLTALKDHCLQNGISHMFVPAHEEDKHALEFYRSTGGKAERTVIFNYSF